MFTYFNEAFRKIMVNIHFLKSDNFPTLTLQVYCSACDIKEMT